MVNIESTGEVIIKSKKRVQNHGEVFTPKWIIDKMINTPGVVEACENIKGTFLEPSAGEGAFLVAILIYKLEMVSSNYNDNFKKYENYSLFALTTLYGVELLEDNAKNCVLNLFQVYLNYYDQACQKHKIKKRNNDVLSSAKTIISANIRQGNFLTRLASNGEPLVFSEWKELTKQVRGNNIKLIRTEYTLDEIQHQVVKSPGETVQKFKIVKPIQLELFNLSSTNESEEEILNYLPCLIKDVHKEFLGN